MRLKAPKSTIPFLLIPVLLALPVMIAHAGEFWTQYESESGIFKTRFPEQRDVKLESFPVDDKRSVNSEEISALIDQRPYKNLMKSYVIKVDQTLGDGLTKAEINTLLTRELGLYEDFYVVQGGTVKSKQMNPILGYPGGEITITYPDPKLGEMNIQAQIMFSPSTRLEEIVVGSAETMTSSVTREFFKSLGFSDGISVTEDMLKAAWPAVDSPLGLFTVNLPPVVKPYFPRAPVIKHADRAENIAVMFKDPVRNESLYYTVYGYQFNTPLTLENAETVLSKNHIAKYKVDPDSIHFVTKADDKKRTVVEAKYNITPPKGFPYLQTVWLRGVIDGPSMLVEEISGSQGLVLASFSQILINNTQFHPESYHEALPDAPAPKAETVAAPAPPPEDESNNPLSSQLKSMISNFKEAEPDAPASPSASPPAATPVSSPQ